MKIICSQCGFESEGTLGDFCPICGKKFAEEDLVPEKVEPEPEPRPEPEPETVEMESDAGTITEQSDTAPEKENGVENAQQVFNIPYNSRGNQNLWNMDRSSARPKKKWLGKIVLLLFLIYIIDAIAHTIPKNENGKTDNTGSAAASIVQGESLQTEDAEKEHGSAEAGEQQFENLSTQITAEVRPSAPGGTYDEIPFAVATASSVLEPESDEFHYEPSRAIDGDIITSWQEGAVGSGEGENLMLYFQDTVRVKYLCLYTGNWRDQERFYNNCRPASMTLYIGGGAECMVNFDDGMKNWYVVFAEPVETSAIQFVINSVYEGTFSDDLCISEVIAYGEP